jgi:hypothetical protein
MVQGRIPMRREFATVLLAGMLAMAPLGLLASPVRAAGDGASQCVDVPNVSRYALEAAKHNGGSDHYGIRSAWFDAQWDSTALLCTGFIPTFVQSGSAVLINIEGWGPGSNAGTIIQVGLFRGQGLCTWPIPCDGQLHFVWTWGSCVGVSYEGCGGPLDLGPTPIDLGVVTTAYAPTFEIFLNCAEGVFNVCEPAVDYWVVTIDNGQDVSIFRTLPLSDVPWTIDPGIELKATVFCETWDNGDQCGGTAFDPYGVVGVQVMNTLHGAWQDPGFKKPCDVADPPYKCTPSSAGVGFYTPDR